MKNLFLQFIGQKGKPTIKISVYAFFINQHGKNIKRVKYLEKI
jgi:hypothetical protein